MDNKANRENAIALPDVHLVRTEGWKEEILVRVETCFTMNGEPVIALPLENFQQQ
jgi:hypothetical protein